MNITKYAHACFSIEKNGSHLLVDPGAWSTDLDAERLEHVVAIVVTHEHTDHMDVNKIKIIAQNNPDCVVYGHADVIAKLSEVPTQLVKIGENVHVGDFALNFVGGEHALIDPSIPRIANLGVLVDNSLYYPGDSFALPEQPIELLGLPVSAPWMKFSEAAAFLRAAKPRQVFPTHDAILSNDGKALADRMFGAICTEIGADYTRLGS